MRVTHGDVHLPRVERGPEVEVLLDGRKVNAHLGETIAAVLLAEGVRVFRRDASGGLHGLYCCMGICYECLVAVDGQNVRACVTPVRPGMEIVTGGPA